MDATTTFETTGQMAAAPTPIPDVGNVPTSRAVPVASLKSDPELQPRAHLLIEATVEKYVADLQDGATLPPITVVERGGAYVIVSGNHRAEAHRRYGSTTIDAVVVPDTGNDALYWGVAFPANTTHGRAYGQDDVKELVRRYVKADRHLNPDGTRKGRRTIQQELLNVRSDKYLEGLVTDAIRELNGIRSNVGTVPTSMPKPSKFTPKRDGRAEATFTAKPSDAPRDRRIAELKAQAASEGKKLVKTRDGYRKEEVEPEPETVKADAGLLHSTTVALKPEPKGSPMEEAMQAVSEARIAAEMMRVELSRLRAILPLIEDQQERYRLGEALLSLRGELRSLSVPDMVDDDRPSLPAHIRASLR